MPTIRITLALAAGIVLGCAAGTAAQQQTYPRVEIGAVARTDHIWVEARASGSQAVAGAAIRVALTKTYGVEAEITKAANTIRRSHEGSTISYATPGSSRDEFERLAVIARHDRSYSPGLGTAFAFTARTTVSPRVGLVGRVGASIRRYDERTDVVVLRVPEGIDPALPERQMPDSHIKGQRGGLLFGVDVPVTLTSRLTVSPELRYVYGGPARVGDKHRELGLGATIGWQF